MLTVWVAMCFCVGCSSDSGSKDRLSRDEYLQHLREIESGADARSASQLFFNIVTPGLSRKGCLAHAREFDRNLHNIVDDVASLSPPRAVQSLQDKFVSAARETIGEVDDAVEDVESGTLGCGMAMNRRIYGLPSTQRAQEVLAELRKRGYQLASNSE